MAVHSLPKFAAAAMQVFTRLCRLAAILTLIVTASTSAKAGGQLKLTVVDEAGTEIPYRIHLKNQQGKPVKIPKLPYWQDHNVCPAGELTLRLNAGIYTFEIDRGPEWVNLQGHFQLDNFADDAKTITLKRIVDLTKEGWYGGELHVHRAPLEMEQHMRAEDLHVAPVMTWWNKRNHWEQNAIPKQLLQQFDGNRFCHLMAGEDEREGGALLYFNLAQPLAIQDATREYPSPMRFLAQAKEQGAWVDIEKPFWWDVPVWLASGQVDSIGLANNHMQREKMYAGEAWGKPRDKAAWPEPLGNGEWSQHIYYQVLNAGLRIPPSAGSASGVLANPVGYNRMYVHVDSQFTYARWWENLKAGRVFVTNGPLLRPRVNGELPGHCFTAVAGEELELEIALNLTTRDEITYLEVIHNGHVVQAVNLDKWAKNNGKLPILKIKQSGWFLIRTICDNKKTFRFASTGPYYVEIGDRPHVSRKAAKFFLDWVNERMERVKLDDASQKEEVLMYHHQARQFWEDRLNAATVE